jgi:hypothetical protein
MSSGSRRSGSPRSRQRGVTYLAVLFFIAASGAMLAATGIIWSHERQRQKEAELLWVGNQFKQAIGLYYQRSPGSVKRYPANLGDLLTTQRYLRQIYRDPMTGKAEWGLIAAPGGGIMGVHSLSKDAPLKRMNLSDDTSKDAKSHADWKFMVEPPKPAAPKPAAR